MHLESPVYETDYPVVFQCQLFAPRLFDVSIFPLVSKSVLLVH